MMLKLGHFGSRKYLGSVDIWCWKWMEKISWTYSVKNEVSMARGISYKEK